MRAAVLLALLSWTPAAWPQEATPKYSKIAPSALTDVPSLQWREKQTVQADREGRVFLLRDKTFELFQISSGGSLVPKGRLLRCSVSLETPPIQDVSMNRAGDAWMLFAFPNRLFMLRWSTLAERDFPGDPRRESSVTNIGKESTNFFSPLLQSAVCG